MFLLFTLFSILTVGSAQTTDPTCVEAHSLGDCAQCLFSDQCPEDWYCCPYMKKCVSDAQHGCFYPIASCSPMCYESVEGYPESCTQCVGNGFPEGESFSWDTWALPTCVPEPEPFNVASTCTFSSLALEDFIQADFETALTAQVGAVQFSVLDIYEGSVVVDLEFNFDSEGEADEFYGLYTNTAVVLNGHAAVITSSPPQPAINLALSLTSSMMVNIALAALALQ